MLLSVESEAPSSQSMAEAPSFGSGAEVLSLSSEPEARSLEVVVSALVPEALVSFCEDWVAEPFSAAVSSRILVGARWWSWKLSAGNARTVHTGQER